MLAPALAAAKPAPLGRWGEQSSLVPDFALPQERRAPKFPDVQKRLSELGPDQIESLDQGLLLCHAQIEGDSIWSAHHVRAPRWDLLGGPDTRFRLTVGAAHPIELWGPEDHWDSYVSIPRLSLRRGDRLKLDVWDRDATSDERIGGAELRFSGALPIDFHGRWFTVSCNAVPADRARELAAPMLETIDRQLDGMERAQPDAEKIGLGDVDGDARFLRGMFKEGWTSRSRRYPLRYAAGAIGWESPEIQARIERLRAVEASWREKCAAKVAEMAAAAPPAGSWQPALGREARVARVVCGREAVRMLGANAQSIDADCVVELELRDRAGAARAQGDGCLGPRPWTLYAYRRDGSYSSAFLFARADDSKLVPCEQAPGASRALVATTRYRGGDVMSQIMSSRHPPAPAAAVLLVIETIERGPAAKALLALPTGPSPPSAPPPAHPPDRAGTPTPDP